MAMRMYTERVKVTVPANWEQLYICGGIGLACFMAGLIAPVAAGMIYGCGAFCMGTVVTFVLMAVAAVLLLIAVARTFAREFCDTTIQTRVTDRVAKCRICGMVHAIKWE